MPYLVWESRIFSSADIKQASSAGRSNKSPRSTLILAAQKSICDTNTEIAWRFNYAWLSTCELRGRSDAPLGQQQAAVAWSLPHCETGELSYIGWHRRA